MQNELTLDSQSIDPNSLSKETLTRELNLKKRPLKVLRMIMNTLESKRQKKGLGWSRSWNKIGFNVFRTHLNNLETDRNYLAGLFELVLSQIPEEDSLYRDFAKDLFADPSLMVFTFYHNHETDSNEFEGLTISLGRKVPDDKTKRDRIDIILEDKRENGSVDGRLDGVSLYINPWAQHQGGEHLLLEYDETIPEAFQGVYRDSVAYYHTWKKEESRQWVHWSVQYIEYFGSRTFIPEGSSFT